MGKFVEIPILSISSSVFTHLPAQRSSPPSKQGRQQGLPGSGSLHGDSGDHGFLFGTLSCFCFTSCSGSLRPIIAREDFQTLPSYPFEDWGPSHPQPRHPPLGHTVVTPVPGSDSEGEEYATGHSLSQCPLEQLTPWVGTFAKLLEGPGRSSPSKNWGQFCCCGCKVIIKQAKHLRKA